jgi:hypothetical protein
MTNDRRHTWWEARRADAAALACIALFFALFFTRVLVGRRFIITGDVFYYIYPLRTVAWQMIRSGELPIWTPHVLSGFPLLATQLALAYPLTWGYLFLPPHWAEQIYVLAPYLLTPAFTYAYARQIGRSPLASLLAGLAFGYGGAMCGAISGSGLLTNSVTWLPLALVGVERARVQRLDAGLALAGAAYALAVLNGHAQGYVYIGVVLLAYGFFLSLFPRAAEITTNDGRWRSASQSDGRSASEDAPPPWASGWRRWQPFAVAVGAIVIGAGVAAFQLLETARAARRSTRRELAYEIMSQGSVTFAETARAVAAPFYVFSDTTPYVAPIALVLAVFGCIFALRRRGARDARIIFWLGVAVVAWVLMLGSNTPLQQLVFYAPALNRFRVPSRHAFEVTFALSVLAAYGFDALASRFANRRTSAPSPRVLVGCLALLGVSTIVGVLWWRAIDPRPPISTYLLWKFAFTAALFAATALAWRVANVRLRSGLLAACLMAGCFVEANAFMWRTWGIWGLDAERFRVVSPVTRILQARAPEEGRVYTRVGLFVEEFTHAPRLEGPNLTALHGLHNVAGIEPLMLERYSRALGNVGPDSVTSRADVPPNDSLFTDRSHVLDLMNATHVVSFTGLRTDLFPSVVHDGIAFAQTDLGVDLKPGARAVLNGAEGDTLALVTALANSIDVEQGSEVARIAVHTSEGDIVELPLRAGMDTAEWAHERADVRGIVRHTLARVFDTRSGDASSSFPAHRYLARIELRRGLRATKIEITNVSGRAALAVSKASLFDSSRASAAVPLYLAPAPRWERVYRENETEVLRNRRALPRAWLVAEALSVGEEEALRMISGESGRSFDPARTALLEVSEAEMPQLPGGEPQGRARVIEYGPNRIAFETDSATPALLVVSEIFYPGWEASVDGKAVQIHLTNFLFRSVAVPPGRHHVEMRYTAPAARVGAIISALTLLFLATLAWRAWRQATPSRRATVTSPR